MKRKQEIPIRPALTLSEKVQIVLNSHMSNRDKIDCIVTLTESEIEERNINLNRKKIRKQIMSEVLYLFEKIEKNQKLKQNRNYIWKRINLIWRNCLQTGWLIPVEEGCDYLENLAKENIQKNQVVVREEKRNTGWHRKTWQRYERFYMGNESKKKRQPTRPRLPLNLTPNKEVDDVR